MLNDRQQKAIALAAVILVLVVCYRITRTPTTQPLSAPTVSTSTTVVAPSSTVVEQPSINPVLRYGSDCLVGGLDEGSLRPVSCDSPHDLQIYREALIEHSVTEFDAEAIDTYANEVCSTSFEAQIQANDQFEFTYIRPTEETWDDSFRVIRCLVFDPTGPMTGKAS